MAKRDASYWSQAVAAVLGVAAIIAHCAIVGARRISRAEYSDFNVFYYAAGAVLRHGDPYLPRHRSYIYPPLIAFLYSPLALLPQQQAAVVILCANALLLTLALILGAKEILRRLDGPTDALAVIGVCLLAMLLLMDKIRGELQMFQTNAVILLMLTLALCWLDRRPAWAGIALGLACNIKYLPLIFLPYLLIRRRWMVAGAFVVSTIGFAFLPAVLSGWDVNLKHLSVALGGLQRMVGLNSPGTETAVIGNVRAGFSLSITSAVARLTHRLQADALMLPILASFAVVLLAIVARMYYRHSLPLWRWPSASAQSAQPYRGIVAIEWVGLVVAALAFSPQTNSRHLVLMLLGTTLVSVMLLIPRRGVPRLPLVLGAAIVLLGLTFPFGGTLTSFARQCRFWVTCAGQSWCLLAFYGLVLLAGLRYVDAVVANRVRIEPFSFHQRHLLSQKLR